MRIAVLASNLIRIPPTPQFVPKGQSGAPQEIMGRIADAMVERGHDVTLFASGDSQTKARLVSVTPKSTILDPTVGFGKHIDYEYLLISTCYNLANDGQFDIIHSTFDVRSAILAQYSRVPTVAILHSPLVGTRKAILSAIPKTQWYVSISNYQRTGLPALQYAATIYHGIDVESYPFGSGKDGYILLAGRMVKEKGVRESIDASTLAHKPLLLVGEAPIGDMYWKESVQPLIDGMQVRHMGFVDKKTLYEQYKNAYAFLMPLQWDEPFGLVMIEAMACGTPVVAYNRGSVSEIITDGVTGFIVDPDENDRPNKGKFIVKKTGIPGLVEALSLVKRLKREQCRLAVSEKFSTNIMMDGYERIYRQVLGVR